jgi:hypothetical protein
VKDPVSGKLTFSDSTSKIKIDDGQIIFGLTYKLQYVDPFLFLVYQLRRLSLEAKLILVVGYGFADVHINGILRQALRGNSEKRLIAVTWPGGTKPDDEKQRDFEQFISRQLELPDTDGKVIVRIAPAKKFLGEELSIAPVSQYFPKTESLFETAPAVDPASAKHVLAS